jgi:pimeloyl-ACP methyl ester carboxylesterase
MVHERLRKLGIGFEAGDEVIHDDRPVLVMVHGAGGRSEVWRNQIYPLRDHFNTLALDLPGHGNTGGQVKDHLEEYGVWLGELLKEIFEVPVHLMGHSMGGAVVQETALRHPQLVKALLLVGTGAKLRVSPMFLEGLRTDFSKTIDAIIGYAYAPDADPLLIREGARVMKEAGAEVTYADFSACDRFDITRAIGGVDLPSLVICGTEDKLTPPSLSAKLQKALPRGKLVILPEAGHMVMIEQFRAFNQTLRGFVAELG